MEEVEVVVLAAPAAEDGAALELQHGGDGRGSEWLALVGPGGREVARRAVPPGSGVLRARWRRGRREVRVTLGPPGGAEGDDGRDGVGGGPAEGEGNPAGTAAVALREVSNEKGRSLAVAEDAPAGSLLLEEEPFLTVVNDKHSDRVCHFCFQAIAGTPLPCPSCGFVRYCSELCMAKDVHSHGGECGQIRALSRQAGQGQGALQKNIRGLRLFLRFTHLRSQCPDEVKRKIDALSYSNKSSNLKNMAKAINRFSQPAARLPEDQLAGLVARLHNNLHGVCDPDFQLLGSGLYLDASLINHSCEPNAVVSFSGRKLCVRALRQLGASEELSIAYTELYAPRYERRSKMVSKKGFTCRCPRCTAPFAAGRGDALLSAIACPSCSSHAPLEDSLDVACLGCGRRFRAETQSKKLNVWRNLYETGIRLMQEGDAAKAADIFDKVLATSATTLHAHHFIRVDSQLALVDCLSEAGADPARCADLALQTAELMAFHLPANHPTLARLRSIAGRELERAGNRDRGAAVAREGRAIYCVAYGPAHPLANA